METRKVINYIARTAIFGALAIILYMVPGLQFPIIPGLSFLKLHFDEIPVLIASLAYGPLMGTLLILIKGAFKLIQDIGETGGIGVLADVIYGLALVIPAALYYKKHRTLKGGLISIIIGIFSNLLVSSVLGFYLIYPLYGFYFNPNAKTYEDAMTTVLQIFNKVDPSLTNPYSFMINLEFILPFNLIKNAIIGVMTFLVYKPILKLLSFKENNK